MAGLVPKGNFPLREEEPDQGQRLHQGPVRRKVRYGGEDHRDLVRRRRRWNPRPLPRLQLHLGRRGVLRLRVQADGAEDDSVHQAAFEEEPCDVKLAAHERQGSPTAATFLIKF